MKQIFFNYFLCSGGEPFKENRQVFDRTHDYQNRGGRLDNPEVWAQLGKKKAPKSGEYPANNGFVGDVRRTIVETRNVDTYLRDSDQKLAALKDEIKRQQEREKKLEGKADAQRILAERNKNARNMVKQFRDVQSEIGKLGQQAAGFEKQATEYRELASKIRIEGSDERKKYNEEVANLGDRVETERAALKQLKADKSAAPRNRKSSFDLSIEEKTALVAELEAKLKATVSADEYAKQLEAEAANLDAQVKRFDHKIKSLEADLHVVDVQLQRYTQGTEAHLQGLSEAEKKTPDLTREQIDAKIKNFDERARARGAGSYQSFKNEAMENGVLDENVDEEQERLTDAEGIEREAKYWEKKWKEDAEKAVGTGISDVKRAELHEKLKNGTISPDKLKITSHPEIVTTAEVFINDLDLPEDTVLFMAHELDYVNTDAFNAAYPKDTNKQDVRNALLNPSLDNIELLRKDHEGFVLAWQFYNMVKNEVSNMSAEVNNTKRNQSKSKEEPVFQTAVDMAQKIGKDAAQAVRDRDYAKMGMYGLLGYGIYKFANGWLKNKLKADPNAEGASWVTKFGHALPYLGAIYAGGWLLAPEKMKTLIGGLQNRDFKGTIVSNFETMQRQAAEGHYKKRLDPTTLFKVYDAPVANIFGPITPTSPAYKESYMRQGMIPLSLGGISNFYSNGLIADGAGAVDAMNAGRTLTAGQKMYIDESKKLYQTMTALKEFYADTVGKDTRITFEDRFINQGSEHYMAGMTMGSMYQMFKNYLPAAERAFADKFKDKPTQIKEDLFGKPYTKDFDQMLDSNLQYGGDFAKTTAFGFPISIKTKNALAEGSSNGKTTYIFYVRGKTSDGDRKVEYTVGDNSSDAAAEIKKMIKERISKFMEGRKALDGDVEVNLENDGKNWYYPVTIPARFLMPEMKGRRVVSCDEAGNIEFYFEGTKLSNLEKVDDLSATESLLKDIFQNGKSNFEALGVMKDIITIPREDHSDLTDTTKHNFDLMVLGVTAKITIVNGQYFMEEADQQKIIALPGFREKYAEKRLESAEYKEYFDMIELVFKKLNTKSFGTRLKGAVTGTFSNIGDALNGKVPKEFIFNGSIPSNYLKVTENAQRLFIKQALILGITSATSFDSIKESEISVKNRFSRLSAYASNIETLISQQLSPSDLKIKVLDPLRTASYNSVVYAQESKEFDRLVIDKFNLSDLSSGADDSTALNLWNVYYYYTAWLDNSSLDTPIDLINNPASENQLLYKKYIAFVRSQIELKMDTNASKAPEQWNIPKYQEWYEDNRDTSDSVGLESLISTNEDMVVELNRWLDIVADNYKDRGDEYYPVIQEVLQAYKDNRVSEYADHILGTRNRNRKQQIGMAQSFATVEFAEACKNARNQAINDKLKYQDGWMGKVNRWVHDKFPELYR